MKLPYALVLVVIPCLLVLLLFVFRAEEGFDAAGDGSLDLVDVPDSPPASTASYSAPALPTPPPDDAANYQALMDVQVSTFPTYHADYSQVDTSSSWMRDPNGNVVNMPFAGKPTSFTYFSPGTLTYSPQTYVPNYTESVFLSAASNASPPPQAYQGFSFDDNPACQSTFV